MITQKKDKQANKLVKKIAGGLVYTLVLGGIIFTPLYIVFKDMGAKIDRERQEKLKIKAMAIGIYKDAEKISDIKGPEDYDKNGESDFYVLFKDGKIMRYFNITNGGDPQEVEDISNRFWWFNGPQPLKKQLDKSEK